MHTDTPATPTPPPILDHQGASGGGARPAPAPPVRVALLGRGTVGTALHELLVEHHEQLRTAIGRDIGVTVALVRDAASPRVGTLATKVELVETIDAVLASRPDIVVEAMGTLEPARSYLLALLAAGIPVVTANKQLIAHHGPELFAAAAAAGTELRFEASVCGAIPIIRIVREALAPSRVERILGILNGTTNYMLSAMSATGQGYDDALADAQRLGYAEADPTEDVGGIDAAAKLSILAGIAFGSPVAPGDVEVEGIAGITADDITNANVLGCRIRLIGRAELLPAAVGAGAGRRPMSLSVSPMLVPEAHPLASITGATNAVLVDGSPFGQLVVQGAGAGGPETASALAGDLASILRAAPVPSLEAHIPRVVVPPMPAAPPRRIEPASTARSERWYVRMVVSDRPGVLAAVAGALAHEEVSIERVLQQLAGGGRASLVLTTHPTTGSRLHAALEGIVQEELTVLPMLDLEAAR